MEIEIKRKYITVFHVSASWITNKPKLNVKRTESFKTSTCAFYTTYNDYNIAKNNKNDFIFNSFPTLQNVSILFLEYNPRRTFHTIRMKLVFSKTK